MARWFSEPIEQLVGYSNRLRRGDLGARTPVTTSLVEIRSLVDAQVRSYRDRKFSDLTVAVECGGHEITPLVNRLWSQAAPDHLSENDEVLACVRAVTDAVGSQGTALRWDGTTWSVLDLGTTENLTGVWGTGPNDLPRLFDLAQDMGLGHAALYLDAPLEVAIG